MNKIYFIFCLLIFIVTACSQEDDYNSGEWTDNLENNDPTLRQVNFSNDMTGVSVLIFQKNQNNKYIFQRSVSSGWSVNGKVSTMLVLGYYKFLFLKNAGTTTSFDPIPEENTTEFEDFKIKATAMSGKDGYVNPVDQIWLPTAQLADKVYEVIDTITVKNTITRAVGQVVVNIKRGYPFDENAASDPNGNIDESNYRLIPMEESFITQNLKDITLDINGVGTSIDLSGSYGNAKTYFSSFEKSIPISLSDGYATMEGPFVFPPEGGNKSSVSVNINMADNSKYRNISVNVANATIEKNYQTVINIWLTYTYQLFRVTVSMDEITGSNDADTGIWN